MTTRTAQARRAKATTAARAAARKRQRRGLLLWCVALAAVVALVAAMMYTARASRDTTARTAPDFTLTDNSGRAVHLADFRGRTVVLYFNEGAGCHPASTRWPTSKTTPATSSPPTSPCCRSSSTPPTRSAPTWPPTTSRRHSSPSPCGPASADGCAWSAAQAHRATGFQPAPVLGCRRGRTCVGTVPVKARWVEIFLATARRRWVRRGGRLLMRWSGGAAATARRWSTGSPRR